MKKQVKVFFDSDVVISSYLSNKGSSYALIKNQTLKRFVTNISKKEILRSTKKLNISESALNKHIKNHFIQVNLKEPLSDIKKKYKTYTSDIDDAHIIRGVLEAKVKILVTFNIKHFNKNKLKEERGINIMTPGEFIQHLRSH